MKKLLIACLVALLIIPAAFADEALQEFVVFEGTATVNGSWQLALGANTTNAYGDFDPYLITEGGYFTVEYTGTAKAIYLALSEWQGGVWASVNAPASCEQVGERLIATFTYDQCLAQMGNTEFSAVDQICAGSTSATGETTIYRIVWHGKPLQDELGADAVLFRGAASSNSSNANLTFCFTKHVGGEFDAAQINPGARMYAEYSGPRNGVYLALSSHSGATHWSRVNPTETVDLGDGRYGAYFDYAAMVKAWGKNFARLDQFTVFSATASPVTLHKLAYFAGEGDPADASDGRWSRPDTGIAFIGDSICQNAQLLFGDWNTILGRTDCCNYGIGGQTTEELVSRIDELASRQYEMVVFICGINDIGRGHTNEEIVANYAAMIDAIRANNPACEFLLVSVLPTTSAFYTGQQGKIVQLNEAYKLFASETSGVTYVDVYPAFTAKAGDYAYPELLSDGLHPNQAGYAKMAEVIAPYLPQK